MASHQAKATLEERSADWSIEALLKKWGLKGALLDLDSLSESSGVDYRSLVGDRSLHLLEIVAV